MDLYQFATLERTAQLAAIWTEGTFLDRRAEAGQWVCLYQLNGKGPDSFFAEVYYNADHNQVQRHRAFVTTTLLLPYVPPALLATAFS